MYVHSVQYSSIKANYVLRVECMLTIYSAKVKRVPNKRSEASLLNIVWETTTLWYTCSILRIGEPGGNFCGIINRT